MWEGPNVERLTALWPLVRDVIIVVTALGLIVFEAVFHDGEVRQALIVAYVGLLASPVFLRRDEKDRQPEPPPREVEP